MAVILSSFYQSVAARRPWIHVRELGQRHGDGSLRAKGPFLEANIVTTVLQREFRPINIRRAQLLQLLQLLPYRDGWPTGPQSLRSQTTHFPDEADNLFTRCLSKCSRNRRRGGISACRLISDPVGSHLENLGLCQRLS